MGGFWVFCWVFGCGGWVEGGEGVGVYRVIEDLSGSRI